MQKKRTTCRRWLLAAVPPAWIALAQQSAAASERPLAQLELEELMDVEVTVATKQPTPVSEVPSTVSVVTAEQIRDHGWLSLNDVLASMPGFARSQDFERRTTSARGVFEGWNSNHTMLLVDGLPFNDADVQTAPIWELTSLEFVDQIEVVRGPASALYGSNALNGAVGLRTLRAADLPGGVRGRFRLGSGTQQLSVVGGEASDAGEVVIGFARFASRGDPRSDRDASLRTDEDGELRSFRLADHRTYHHAMMVARPDGLLTGLVLRLDTQDSATNSLHGWFFMAPAKSDLILDRRLIGSATYTHKLDDFAFEHALQWQRTRSQIDVRLVPRGVDELYPDGIEEVQDFGAHTVFARSQATVALPREASVISGAEYRVLVLGDSRHQLNTNPIGDLEPFGELREVGGLYEAVEEHPLHRIAAFGQLDSGEVLGSRARLFLGGRYDGLLASYEVERTTLDKRFHQLSPRAGLVLHAHERLTAKLMAGRAFRTPSAAELFTMNSWVATANPETLEPEVDITYEAALDALLHPALRIRSNAFHAERGHQVGYTLDESSRLGNLYTSRRFGVETEALSEHRLSNVDLAGYASYSFVHLIDEQADDPSVSAEQRLTNVPAHLAKLGVRAGGRRWSAGIAAYAQGRTFRRASERATVEFLPYRPSSVPAFVSFDIAAAVEVTKGMRLGLQVANLLDDRARIAAVTDAPFDYRVPPRRVLVMLELEP